MLSQRILIRILGLLVFSRKNIAKPCTTTLKVPEFLLSQIGVTFIYIGNLRCIDVSYWTKSYLDISIIYANRHVSLVNNFHNYHKS